ncbi:MAG: hypothetical protein IPP77_15770 [Bacteroidetes bacterium]|nr:hypothetical protein [Bacteroidota bacterium]
MLLFNLFRFKVIILVGAATKKSFFGFSEAMVIQPLKLMFDGHQNSGLSEGDIPVSRIISSLITNAT